jgi:hypothetical protein
MKKMIAAMLVGLSMVSFAVMPASAQRADGQSCHDASECASGNCGTNSSGARVCLPNPTADSPVDPDSLEVTSETLDSFDPLQIEGSPYAQQFAKPAGIVSRVLDFAFPLAGIILFVMIVIGGFQMVMGAGEQKAMESGRQRVTYAIIGFILLFSVYWIAQILETLLNIKIL